MLYTETYDAAVKAKLESAFSGSVLWAPAEKAFKVAASKNPSEAVKMPFISLFRSVEMFDTPRYNMPSARRGNVTLKRVFVSEDDPPVETLRGYIRTKSFPVKLPYKINIWAGSQKIASRIENELVFYLEQHPSFLIQIPDAEFTEAGQQFQFSLIMEDLSDNTEFGSDERGKIYNIELSGYVNGFLMVKGEQPKVVHEVPVTYKDGDTTLE